MARSFNGSSDFIDLGTGAVFNIAPPLSVSVWVYPTALSAIGNVWVKNQANTNVYGVYIDNTGIVHLQATGIGLASSGTVSTNTWTHIGGNTGPGAVYLNGTKDNTGNWTWTAPVSGNLNIGQDPVNGGRSFTGRIADFALWNVVLTDSEMSSLGKSGARPYTVRPASLIAYLPLDGLQSPEPDFSGGAHNGTLTGTALVANPPMMMFTPRWPQMIIRPTVAVGGGFINPDIVRANIRVFEGYAT